MRGGVISRIDTLEANLNIKDNTTNVGNSSNKLLLKGTETRPSYNNDSTQLALKSDADSVASSVKNHTDNKSNPHGVTKAQVGLSNVDNTSDVNKPISTATQAALDKKQGKLTAGAGITIDANNRITATTSGTNYWTLSDTTLSPVSGVNTVSCSAIDSPSSSLTLSGKEGVEILANGTKYLDIKTNGIFMPNLSTSSVSADQPILFTKNADGWITKASEITGNPVTGELKATKVTTTGDITSSGELIFPQTSTYTANTCGLLRYNDRLLLGDLGNGVSISKIGTNESIIKQADHSGQWTYVLPDTAGNMLSYQEKTSTEEYNRLNHEITLPVQQPSASQDSGYRHISGAIGRYYIDQFTNAYVNLSAYYNKAELTVSGSQQPVCIEFFKNGNSTIGCRMACNSDVFIVVDQDRDYNYYGTINIWCPSEGKFYSSSYTCGHLIIYSTNGNEFNVRGDLYTDKNIITRNSLPSWYSKSGTSEVNVSYTAVLSSANTFTGLNTFTGTVKANSIMDNVNNQVIKGSSFRIGAGTYTLQTLLKMVFTTIPSNYMVTIKCPSGNMTVADGDLGISYESAHCWDYDSSGYQAVDYFSSSYVHDEDSASTDTSLITVTCTAAIQVIISC